MSDTVLPSPSTSRLARPPGLLTRGESLRRAADAFDAMAKERVQLEANLDLHRRLCRAAEHQIARFERQLAARKGQITKLKKRIQELEHPNER